MDIEQLAQEDALWPWLASDCMADQEAQEIEEELEARGIPLSYQEPTGADCGGYYDSGWGACPDR